MIPISVRGEARGVTAGVVGKVSLLEVTAEQERRRTVRVLAAAAGESLDGYAAVLTSASVTSAGSSVPTVLSCRTDHLCQGDVVEINTRGEVRTVYRRNAGSNTLFTTDRCNNLCLMCSHPPRDVDDSGRVVELLRLIDLIDPSTESLGITGGEPTLLGDGLLEVVRAARDRLPKTSLHVLSNGRRLIDYRYADAFGGLAHPNLMFGIPLYSDIGSHHDYIVQAGGVFNETMRGLHNLARARVPVEIRVVVHAQTYRRLPQLADFIFRNLTFAAHVTFMGLEVIGFGKANVKSLWIDPLDYVKELEERCRCSPQWA